MKNEAHELTEFFNFIYGENEGIVGLAIKAPGNPTGESDGPGFKRYFFEFPRELPAIVAQSLKFRDNFDVYYAPALFKEASGTKEAVKGSNVYWVEFDGNAPDIIPADIPAPSMRIQSSIPGHEHWYWRSDKFISPYDLEKVNRALTYKLKADTSGWDACQILRPIHTHNHKRDAPVGLLATTSTLVSTGDFAKLPEPPALVEVPLPTDLPEISDVLSKYKIPDAAWQLFKQGKPQGERSEGMMQLGYFMAEIGMENDEIFAVLLNADMRWGKFKDREDQLQRLQEIVTIARNKYPFGEDDYSLTPEIESLGLVTFLHTEYNFEWVWDGYLQKNGYFMLTGPSGVGKTQFSLNAAMNMALGIPFLEKPTSTPKRIGILSLEMGGPDLQFFLKQQVPYYDAEQLAVLQENLIIAPVGEPIYMDTQEGKEKVEQWIVDNKLDGIMVDSLGSAMAGDVSAESSVKSIMAWNDNIRQRLDVFTWFIHHHRKATGDNKKPNKLQDVYGSMYLTARATSVVCLWNVGIASDLQVLPLKMRLSPDKDPFTIHRDTNLIFSKKGNSTVVESTEASPHEAEESSGDIVVDTTAGTGFSI